MSYKCPKKPRIWSSALIPRGKENHRCLVCGTLLYRNRCKNGTWEILGHWQRRKTCSRECKNLLQTGRGNPNYKGILPKCIDCGKRCAYKGKIGDWKRCKRCLSCFKKWAKKTDYFKTRPQSLLIAEKMRRTKGIQPEALKPFAFKKGHKYHASKKK